MADEKQGDEFPSLDDFWSTGGGGGEESKSGEAGGVDLADLSAATAPAEAGGAAAPASEPTMSENWDDAMKELAGEAPAAGPAKAGKQVQAKTFDTIEAAPPMVGEGRNLEIILDIPLEVTAELGSAKIMVQDFLRLGLGSIIELQKLAGEPVEVLVNGTLIARGEVVVVNEKFGVRLTDIVSQAERIKKLG